ncbi:MAG: tRNA (adenosine(37)-N6)-dimethylallyltransferase MiaA [Bacteroidales bacterium]
MTSTAPPPLIVITGPTATGKTRLAARVARESGGEVISADSRQVYRGMDLGSGKDLNDFLIDGEKVPHHLIDIAEAGGEYNVFAFQQDFLDAYRKILSRNNQPVLCGGTGLYIEAAIGKYRLLKVPKNSILRKQLSGKPMEELAAMLKELKPLHNTTDTNDKDRLMRAIEIETYQLANQDKILDYPKLDPVLFAIWFDRKVLRERITHRLARRLEQGMTDEVKGLLDQGLRPEQLTFYGLEYRYLTLYVTGKLSYDEMFRNLNTAIHQFAKRQMTWFRRMERSGHPIHWIDGDLSMEEKVRYVLNHTKGNPGNPGK